MSAINPYQPPSAPLGPEVRRPDEEIRLATTAQRFLGALIDNVILIVCVFITIVMAAPFWPGVVLMVDEDADFLSRTSIAFLSMMPWLIVEAYLIVTRGKSVGKLILKTRIVRVRDQSPVGFVDGVLLRRWLFVLFGVVPIIGRLIGLADALAIFRQSTRCLHDDLAGTIVIDERPVVHNPWRDPQT